MRQISNQIFNTPTGRTYDPSEKIDRSFQRVGAQVEKMITDESDRKKREEDMFNQTYANIGEIEANLQQNYAGIMQQAVDSTKDYLKQQIKSGSRINDPEFQMGLQDRVSRIKTAVGNADRNREQLKQATELIKTDPAIMDKQTALTSLMTRFNDPDFLISKNPFNADEFLENFVNPIMVFEEARKSIPSDGTDEFMTDDDQGNTFKNSIIYNRLIPRDQPTLEDGSPNIQISDDFAQEVLAGKFGQRLLNITSKDAQSKYSDLPKDLAFKNALRDGFRTVMGSNFKRGIFETGDQKRRREGQERRQNTATDLAIKREQRMAGKLDDQDEVNDRYERFVSSVQSVDKSFLGSYDNINPNVKDFNYTVQISNGTELPTYDKLMDEVSTPEKWMGLTRDRRKDIIESITDKKIGKFTDSDTMEFYQEVMGELQNASPVISYKQREGSSQGSYNWSSRTLPLGSDTDIDYAFQTLENLRLSGTKAKPEPKITTKETPLSGAARFNPK